MQIAVDYDDFSPLNHRFDMLDSIRERYPDFKVTMFTVPWEIRLSPSTKGTPITDEEYKPWVERVVEAQKEGWMDIALHGLTHAPREFEKLSYQDAKNRIIVGQKMFQNVGIELNGMFKAPQWLINENGKKAVEDLGLKLMEDGYYNWNLKDDKPKKKKKLIAHGHIQDEPGSWNGIEESFFRLTKVPTKAEWVHLKDLV